MKTYAVQLLAAETVSKVERPVEHHCECRSCHYCGKTKRSARAAIKAWNREFLKL